ncbi:hypothetical protein ACFVJK_42845 [Streptomyces sp. NPDC127172]|uniref:hypothetical protein n=1 Tax=Streptomyces sp. NPDC127172 TaxID=3345382 RepID=UPI0036309807
MDITHAPQPRPRVSRAILVTLLILGCGDVAFACGIFAASVGNLSTYAATATGSGAFIVTLVAGLSVLSFTLKDGDGAM